MKKKIKINFIDFWSDFSKDDNFFFNILNEIYEVEISNNPDFIFFSVFGDQNKIFNCKKIFYTGENISPNFNECDFALSFDNLSDERNYRLPVYILEETEYYYPLVKKEVSRDLFNRKFCSFVVSNTRKNSLRKRFFDELCKYKKVDSGGRGYNNIGNVIGNRKEDKIQFQNNYKFAITFENQNHRGHQPGYITEKIVHAMSANTIPIYYGGSLVSEDFNEKSFINGHNFDNFNDLINFIIEIDSDEEKYYSMLKEPWFNDNKIPENNQIENIKAFLIKIFE